MRVEKIQIADINQSSNIYQGALGLVTLYYLEPEIVLKKGLSKGNYLLYSKKNSRLGAFLIINEGKKLKIKDKAYVLTYLGLGAAKTLSVKPLFQKAKNDLNQKLAESENGLIYLTSSTPFAYRSILSTYQENVFPSIIGKRDAERNDIASQLWSCLGYTTDNKTNPYVIKNCASNHYIASEDERLKNCDVRSPIERYDINHFNGDRLVIFHIFEKLSNG